MAAEREAQAANPRTWTIEAVLRWVTDDFRGRGLDSPRLEAELLLANVLQCNRIQLIVDRDRPLAPDELASYRALVARRRRHEPVAYLRGEREFYGHALHVDKRVLIPRPDTETLVETALQRTAPLELYGTMLDLCTGSGNVAIAFAKERPTWKVLATDVSADALAVAAENALRLGCLPNMAFRQGNLFEAVPAGSRFDLITANPPYIPSGDLPKLSADIRDHEPHLALDGGADGLDVVRQIVAGAAQYLEAGGLVAIEVQFDQTDRVEALMNEAGLVETRMDRDLGGRPRVVSARKAGE